MWYLHPEQENSLLPEFTFPFSVYVYQYLPSLISTRWVASLRRIQISHDSKETRNEWTEPKEGKIIFQRWLQRKEGGGREGKERRGKGREEKRKSWWDFNFRAFTKPQDHSHRAPVWPVCFPETVLMKSHLPVPLVHSVLSGTFD